MKSENQPNFSVPVTERLKGFAGIFGIHIGEMPHYDVLFQEGDKEVRSYDPMILATTYADGNLEQAQEAAFNRLAGFIYGNNQTSEKLSMTAPVLEEETDRGIKMSFIMPTDLPLNWIPIPVDSSIVVNQLPKQVVAALKFTGPITKDKRHPYCEELKAWVESHHMTVEKVLVAQYDSPATIPFLRKNEIQIITKSLH